MNNHNYPCYSLPADTHRKNTKGIKKTPRELHDRYRPLFPVLFIIGMLLPKFVLAQSPGSDGTDSAHLTLSGSVDVYYAHYDDSLPSESFRQTGAISPRSDQFGLNLAQVRLAYDHPSVRGRLALHYGDIPLSSWSADFPMLQEATIGVSLGNNLWIDGGFFPTHIGTESFMPGSNRISSIAAITFFEPFYQSGVRIAYEGSEEFSAQLHLLNGYNTFVDHNSSKSVGTYLSWRTSKEVNLIYAALFGDDAPDTSKSQFRTHHNVQVVLDPSDNFRMAIGFDFCSQNDTAQNGGTISMSGGLLMLSYTMRPDWRINTRLEFLNDRVGLLAGAFPNEAGEIVRTTLTGATLGIEHRPTETSYIRLEGRLLQTPEATTFFGGAGVQRQRIDVGLTGGIAFDASLF